MSKICREILTGIATLALLSVSTQALAQATDVDCTKCVDDADIAFQAVTTSKIGKKAVTSSRIAAEAITAGKIKDGAVTVDKVAPELSSSLGTFCAPGEYVAGQDSNGSFICKSLKPLFTQDCVFANGLSWCFNNAACGEACADVCAAKGLSPVTDEGAWFDAQDTAGECQAIASALGLATINLGTWSVGCLEDTQGIHSVDGGLIEPLLCSTQPTCPSAHLTNMDQLGVACGVNSRRSVCPCE